MHHTLYEPAPKPHLSKYKKLGIEGDQLYFRSMITHLDEQIGRILKTLKERGLAENTIIVLSADNGLAVGQHGLMGKQNLYKHSIGVPLAFKGSNIPKGERKNTLPICMTFTPHFAILLLRKHLKP